MADIESIHDVEWSWSGWNEGEELDPPEPGKRWLTIHHWGEEYAVIVHRLTPGIGNTNPEIMLEKEDRAKLIVHALRTVTPHAQT